MSIELCVLLRDQDVPSRAEWQSAISAAGIDLLLDEFDVRAHTGYLPVTETGRKTGFEYYFGDADQFDWVAPTVRGDRNKVISFVLHSDSEELRAATLAAAVLTSRFGGLYADEYGETAVGDELFASIARGEAEEQAARSARAAADAAITDRRCPKCGSPCPTYRKTCEACGFNVGRA